MRTPLASFKTALVRGVAAFALAALAPVFLTLGVLLVDRWPTPYSWQYLGATLLIGVVCGAGPALITLVASYIVVVWLQVPTPVHPGAEMFAAAGLVLLILLHRWRSTERELLAAAEAHQAAREEEKRRAEIALREQTSLLRAISDASRDSIYAKDLDGRIRFGNPAMFETLGKPAHEVLGKTDAEILEDPEEGRRIMENDRLVMESGMARDLEEVVRAADGTESIWLSRKTPYRDEEGNVIGLLGISTNITERQRIAEALGLERQKLQSIIQALPVGLGIMDMHGNLLSMNEASLRLHDFSSEGEMLAALPEYVKRFELLRLDGSPVPVEEWPASRALRGESFTADEVRLRNRKTGRERIVSYTVVLVKNSAGASQLIAFLMDDITDRKRAEQELRAANAQLQDADRRKNEFIAVLSHELRNPLAPIRYALPLIEQAGVEGSAARGLEVIHRQVGHLTRLVDDLLDVSRITHGAIELRLEHVALRPILNAAAEAAAPGIIAARHELKIAVPEEPIWVYADSARLAQVVTNLLNNAAKYTQRGGTIELSAARDNGHACIRVRDNGVGIPPESLAGIFDMFRRLDSVENTTPQGGLGIGLALSKRLVEMHGGTIEARSGGGGQGSEFEIRLPIAADVHSRPSAEQPGDTAVPTERLKVLVVDDNADLVDMLATVVEDAGHDVRKALDGRSAIAAAIAYRPDVMLLDLGLPLVSGIDVARELRKMSDLASLRIVALTGWGQSEDRERTTEAGFDYHLTKPSDPQVLTELLTELAATVHVRRM